MAEHETVTKTVITRAWTDLEPKFVAWLSAGGLLTAATLVFYYIDPNSTLPVWVAPVVTYLGGLVVAYLKKSSVPVVVPADTADVSAVTPIPATPAPVDPDITYSTDAP